MKRAQKKLNDQDIAKPLPKDGGDPQGETYQ